MAPPDSNKKIGELNGKWAAWFKGVLVLVPVGFAVGLSFSAWVASSVIDLQRWQSEVNGNRFTTHDARDLELRWQNKFDTLPPAAFIGRVEKLEAAIARIDERLDVISVDTAMIRMKILGE